MPAPPSRTWLGWCEDTAARNGGLRSGGVNVTVGNGAKRIGETVRGWGGVRNPIRALAHRVGQGNQFVVLVGVRGLRQKGSGMTHEVPPARRGDAAGMPDTQIPRVGFARGGQRSYHCRGVRVDERQRRYGIVRTPGPAAATGNIHEREAIAGQTRHGVGHAAVGGPTSNRYSSSRGRAITPRP